MRSPMGRHGPHHGVPHGTRRGRLCVPGDTCSSYAVGFSMPWISLGVFTVYKVHNHGNPMGQHYDPTQVLCESRVRPVGALQIHGSHLLIGVPWETHRLHMGQLCDLMEFPWESHGNPMRAIYESESRRRRIEFTWDSSVISWNPHVVGVPWESHASTTRALQTHGIPTGPP